MEQKIQDSLSEFGLKLDDESRSSLYKTSRWTKFISVAVFSLGALLFIFFIAAKDKMTFYLNREMGINASNGARFWIFFSMIFLMIAIISVIYYFLFKFSANIKKGFETEQTDTVIEGFKSLKIYFIITTILSGLILLTNLLGIISKLIQ